MEKAFRRKRKIEEVQPQGKGEGMGRGSWEGRSSQAVYGKKKKGHAMITAVGVKKGGEKGNGKVADAEGEKGLSLGAKGEDSPFKSTQKEPVVAKKKNNKKNSFRKKGGQAPKRF